MNHFVKEDQNDGTNIGLTVDCKILLLLDNCTGHSNSDPSALSSNNIVALIKN